MKKIKIIFFIFFLLSFTNLFAEQENDSHIVSYVNPTLPKNSYLYEQFYGYPKLKGLSLDFFYNYERNSSFKIDTTDIISTVHTNIPSLSDNVTLVGAYNGVSQVSLSVGTNFAVRVLPFLRFIFSYYHSIINSSITYTVDANITMPTQDSIRKQSTKYYTLNNNNITAAIELSYYHKFSKLFIGYATFTFGGGISFLSAVESISSKAPLGLINSDLKIGTWILLPKNFFLNTYLGVMYKASFGSYSVTIFDRIDYSNDYNPSGNLDSRLFFDMELKGRYSQKYVEHFNMVLGISASYSDIITLGINIGFINQLSILTFLNFQF